MCVHRRRIRQPELLFWKEVRRVGLWNKREVNEKEQNVSLTALPLALWELLCCPVKQKKGEKKKRGAEVSACNEKIKAKVIWEFHLSDIKLIMLQLLPVPSFQVDRYMSKSTVVLHRQYRHYHHHNHRYHFGRTHPYLHAILPEAYMRSLLPASDRESNLQRRLLTGKRGERVISTFFYIFFFFFFILFSFVNQ